MKKSDKKCNICLIAEGTRLLYDFFAVGGEEGLNPDITEILLNKDGICQYCQLYQKNFEPEHLKKELEYFIGRESGEYQAILALSGGKDSIAAMYIAKELLGLDIIAFTYDNGFIPPEVLKQSERICHDLNVPYHIARRELYREFREEYFPDARGVWQAKKGIDFCQICSGALWQEMKKLIIQKNICQVIFGNKIYTKLSPKVSSLKSFSVNNKNVLCLNLLFALQTGTESQNDILKILNWRDPKLEGYTSNCLIPGFSAYPRSKKINAPSDAGYIEMELRSGTYSRQEAEEILKNINHKDNSSEIIDFFDKINVSSTDAKNFSDSSQAGTTNT